MIELERILLIALEGVESNELFELNFSSSSKDSHRI